MLITKSLSERILLICIMWVINVWLTNILLKMKFAFGNLLLTPVGVRRDIFMWAEIVCPEIFVTVPISNFFMQSASTSLEFWLNLLNSSEKKINSRKCRYHYIRISSFHSQWLLLCLTCFFPEKTHCWFLNFTTTLLKQNFNQALLALKT